MSGDELRRRREALELTQRAPAVGLGIHFDTLGRWERQGMPRLCVELTRGRLARLEAAE